MLLSKEPPTRASNRRQVKRLLRQKYRLRRENANARSLRRALSREESRSELIARLTAEFAPVPVEDLADQHPGAKPGELVMLITRAWRQLRE
jgi:hypothetical protein